MRGKLQKGCYPSCIQSAGASSRRCGADRLLVEESADLNFRCVSGVSFRLPLTRSTAKLDLTKTWAGKWRRCLLVTAASTGTRLSVAQRLQVEGFAALFLDFDPADGIPAGRDWEQEL